MLNLDAMYNPALDRQQQLLNEAARIGLVRSGSREDARATLVPRPWRATCAAILRRVADRLEPAAARPQVRVLRAVAHREISVDQALRLLDSANGTLRR